MNTDTEALIANIEQSLREELEVTSISELTDFPFTSLQEIKTARESGQIAFGTPDFMPGILDAFGTRTDFIMSRVWSGLPFLLIIGFITFSFLKSNLLYLFGILTTAIGFFLSSPYARMFANPILGLAWIGCIYFVFVNPVWAWVIAGFYAGYMFPATAREQFRMLMEERALQSEIIFCYLYLSKILRVIDNKTGKLI